MSSSTASAASTPEGQSTTAIQQLSDRELEIFQLIGDGYATHEIAERLHLSVKTSRRTAKTSNEN